MFINVFVNNYDYFCRGEQIMNHNKVKHSCNNVHYVFINTTRFQCVVNHYVFITAYKCITGGKLNMIYLEGITWPIVNEKELPVCGTSPDTMVSS